MLRRTLMAAAAVCAVAAAPAHAAVTIGSEPGSDPYSGGLPTYDFDGFVPTTGGLVANTVADGIRARPLGSTGNYWSVGPGDGPGLLDLSSFASILSLSFIWGSVDLYNTLEVLGRSNEVLATFTGVQVPGSGDFGSHTSLIANPIVTLTFNEHQTNIGGLRLTSTSNAFEVDNFVIAEPRDVGTAVPEPGTWAMMLLGFGLVGFGLRKRAASQGQSRFRVAYS